MKWIIVIICIFSLSGCSNEKIDRIVIAKPNPRQVLEIRTNNPLSLIDFYRDAGWEFLGDHTLSRKTIEEIDEVCASSGYGKTAKYFGTAWRNGTLAAWCYDSVPWTESRNIEACQEAGRTFLYADPSINLVVCLPKAEREKT